MAQAASRPAGGLPGTNCSKGVDNPDDDGDGHGGGGADADAHADADADADAAPDDDDDDDENFVFEIWYILNFLRSNISRII